MCCLLCLQWAFSLNNFAGIDLVKLIPHTVYSYGLRIRPTLSVHGAETPCRNEALSLCSPIFIVNVICRPMLYFGERVRESERERERERGIKLFICSRPIRHIEPSA